MAPRRPRGAAAAEVSGLRQGTGGRSLWPAPVPVPARRLHPLPGWASQGAAPSSSSSRLAALSLALHRCAAPEPWRQRRPLACFHSPSPPLAATPAAHSPSRAPGRLSARFPPSSVAAPCLAAQPSGLPLPPLPFLSLGHFWLPFAALSCPVFAAPSPRASNPGCCRLFLRLLPPFVALPDCCSPLSLCPPFLLLYFPLSCHSLGSAFSLRVPLLPLPLPCSSSHFPAAESCGALLPAAFCASTVPLLPS